MGARAERAPGVPIVVQPFPAGRRAARNVHGVTRPSLIAVPVLAGCVAMSAAAPWAATASLRIVVRTTDSLTLSVPAPARGQTHEGRYRTAQGRGRWRTVRLES